MSIPTPLEQDIQKTCLQWLQYNGWFAWRNNTGAFVMGSGDSRRYVRAGAVGSGDIFALKNGVFLSVEVKRPGKHPTSAQASWADSVRRKGGVALCVHSLDELIGGIEGIDA